MNAVQTQTKLRCFLINIGLSKVKKSLILVLDFILIKNTSTDCFSEDII